MKFFKADYKFTTWYKGPRFQTFNIEWMSRWGMTGAQFWLEDGIIGVMFEKPVRARWRFW